MPRVCRDSSTRFFGDATRYLGIFTGQLLAIFFQIFAPVSDPPTNLRPFPHGELRAATDSTSPRKVSGYLGHFDEDETNGELSYSQWDDP